MKLFNQMSHARSQFEELFPNAEQYRCEDGYLGDYKLLYQGFLAGQSKDGDLANTLRSRMKAELDVADAASRAGTQMDDREREYLKGMARGVEISMTVLSQEQEVLQNATDWKSYATKLHSVLQRGYKSLASAAMCQTRDGEAAWLAMGEALTMEAPAKFDDELTLRISCDATLGHLLDNLRSATFDQTVPFGQTELYHARERLIEYLRQSVVSAKDVYQEELKDQLANLCAAFKWRTDGSVKVLIERISHQVREQKAAITAHKAVLEKYKEKSASATEADDPTRFVDKNMILAGYQMKLHPKIFYSSEWAPTDMDNFRPVYAFKENT